MYRKTIEFRMHEGTTQFDQIFPWALWCGWFVELAVRLNDNEAAQIKTVSDLLSIRIERKFSPPWGIMQPSKEHPKQFDLATWIKYKQQGGR